MKNNKKIYDFSLKCVLENRNFYKVNKNLLGRVNYEEQIDRLQYGIHLIRCDIFRLRSLEQGLKEDWIESNYPDFIRMGYRLDNKAIVHQNLRRQLEYLRSDLIISAARFVRISRGKKMKTF